MSQSEEAVTAGLSACLAGTAPMVRATLEACLEGRELSWEDAVPLCKVTGVELSALCSTADALRRAQVGDQVAYVVNRNINFTNACVKACKFCAFARGHR